MKELSENYKYLSKIDSPADLRSLPEEKLQDVCDELRRFLIESVTRTGGHFGSGLGVVELTVAIHYVFDTPDDQLIFDVGHQAYPHKILTGRRDKMHTIRKKDGLSGYPNISESPYDAFGVGHASTSISAALGMAAARDFTGKKNSVIAVIGDGAMTGGLAYEALNNAGYQDRDMLVIFNDNNFSIGENISGVSKHFNNLFASKTGINLKNDIYNALGKVPGGDRLRHYASKLEDSVKAITTPGVLFESLGFNYIGPVNGHNISKLVRILQNLRQLTGPVFFHIMTEKGKGYKPAEEHSQHLHAIKGSLDMIPEKHEKPKAPTYSTVFGEAALQLCKMKENVFCITAAMSDGTGLNIVQEEMPERVLDVGIAEGHAVTFAAGLATKNIIPIVAVYSTFLQRAFDNIIHDIALQNLHVVFALDRAGIVGDDGPTHHGPFDLSYLRPIPNMTIMAPKDEQELRNMLRSAVLDYTDGPSAIRYPRGSSPGTGIGAFTPIEKGTWEYLQKGQKLAVLAVGTMVAESRRALDLLGEQGKDIALVNARFVKPLDTKILDEIFAEHDRIITIEENQIAAGFGSAVLEYASKKSASINIELLGIPDSFVPHGKPEELLADIGLDAKALKEKFIKYL